MARFQAMLTSQVLNDESPRKAARFFHARTSASCAASSASSRTRKRRERRAKHRGLMTCDELVEGAHVPRPGEPHQLVVRHTDL